jgi:hypothetical protein
MRIRRVALVLLVVLGASALLSLLVHAVEKVSQFGSTAQVDEVRPLGPIHGVASHGSIELVLKHWPIQRVTVEAPQDQIASVETVVVDGLLDVRMKTRGPHIRFGSDRGVVVTVEAPDLSSIATDGSGDVTASGLQTDLLRITMKGSGDVSITDLAVQTLAVQMSGSGDFEATGHASTQGFVIEGSGDVDCHNLEGAQVAVMIRGSGDAHVNATESLQIDIGGSGDVRYRGEPHLSPRIHGSGSVRHD